MLYRKILFYSTTVSISLFFFVFLPHSVHATPDDTYSRSVPGEVLHTHGITIEWENFTLSVPSGIYKETTQLRIRNRGELKSKKNLPKLPKRFRSNQNVYALHASDVSYTAQSSTKEITLEIPYTNLAEDDLRRRIFFLEEKSKQWERLRSVVHISEKTIQATLPSTEGKLVVAKHRYKSEAPIKKKTFSSYGRTPYSDSAAVIDAKSGKFLYSQNQSKQRSIASITKIATTLIFLETNPNLDELIYYSADNDRDGAAVVLNNGEQITLKQVLMGVLIPSANNMAQTLSVSTSFSESDFISQVNSRMKELGLYKTTIVEATGLNEENKSSAGNIVRLARYVFDTYSTVFEEAADWSEYVYYTANTQREMTLYTTNQFNGDGKYDAVAFKTGYLPGSAERTLVVKIRENATGHEIILSLLGNPQYNTIFQEAYDLAEWAFENWEFHNYE